MGGIKYTHLSLIPTIHPHDPFNLVGTERPYTQEAVALHWPCPPPQATAVYPLSLRLPLHQVTHTGRIPPYLPSRDWLIHPVSVLQFHPRCRRCRHLPSSMTEHHSAVCTYQILFIRGRVGGFHILATVENAARTWVSPQDPAFTSFGLHSEVKLLDRVAALSLIFSGTAILFSTRLNEFTFPVTYEVWGCRFFYTTLLALVTNS